MLQRHKWGDLRYDSSYEVRVSNTRASSVADCEYPLNQQVYKTSKIFKKL